MYVEDNAKTTNGHSRLPTIRQTAAPSKMAPGVAM